MSAVAEKLLEARKLIERGWTQGAFARTKSGNCIGMMELNAACFCAMGAVYRVCDLGAAPAFQCFELLEKAVHRSNVAEWNDRQRRTQAEVLAAFDKAIELARAEAK